MTLGPGPWQIVCSYNRPGAGQVRGSHLGLGGGAGQWGSYRHDRGHNSFTLHIAARHELHSCGVCGPPAGWLQPRPPTWSCPRRFNSCPNNFARSWPSGCWSRVAGDSSWTQPHPHIQYIELIWTTDLKGAKLNCKLSFRDGIFMRWAYQKVKFRKRKGSLSTVSVVSRPLWYCVYNFPVSWKENWPVLCVVFVTTTNLDEKTREEATGRFVFYFVIISIYLCPKLYFAILKGKAKKTSLTLI